MIVCFCVKSISLFLAGILLTKHMMHAMNFIKLSKIFKTQFPGRNCLLPSVRSLSSPVITDEVLFERRNNVGIIKLNRPKALNALNECMVKSIQSHLKKWESECNFIIFKSDNDKAFCAGGDIISAVQDKSVGKALAKTINKTVYLISNYKRPCVFICNGITMGTGVGLSMQGTYRIITERTVLAMPETQIGLFPDVGASYFLPRLEGKLGLFLGLSGYQLRGTDIVKIGIGTHFVHSSDIASLFDKLSELDANQLDEFLNAFAVDISQVTFTLQPFLPIINSCFCGSTVEEIYRLLRENGNSFSENIANFLDRLSPTSMKITKRLLELGAKQDLKDCLKTEFRLSFVTVEKKITADFYEGVRALLIDKDKTPKWQPKFLADVTEDMVNKAFEPLPEEEELDI